jgi:predicted ATPase
MTTEAKLNKVRVAGFRSLRDVTLDLGPVTVLIGPNGSGKSNLLSALRLVTLMRAGSLARFVSEQGGASALLHYGAQVTQELSVGLEFASSENRFSYSGRLGYAAGDVLAFRDEYVAAERLSDEHLDTFLGSAGLRESILANADGPGGENQLRILGRLVSGMGFFHFPDTSPTSPLRQNSRQVDNRALHPDGANLAAFLYRLKNSDAAGTTPSWNLISALVRRIAPFIKTLDPDLVDPDHPETSAVRLYWTDERDHRFDAHDLSDGTLRAIALLAALAQHSASLPSFVVIDEPELGLHPSAIGLFASLVHSVSTRCQVLITTQSPALLDEFEPDEVVVTERSRGETSFKRLDPAALASWLEEYSLSQLYQKNVLGGRP